MRASRMSLAVIGLALVLSPVARAAPVQWPVNGHYYELVTTHWKWTEACEQARSRYHMGLRGHLATFASAAEADFVRNALLPGPDVAYWVGGYQPPGSPEPALDWRWVTGEPFAYSAWLAGEPNDFGCGGSVQEDNLQLNAGGGWNDVGWCVCAAYIVEYEPGDFACPPIEHGNCPGPCSLPQCGAPPPPPPPPPGGVGATSGERCRVIVQWLDVAGETGYRIRRNGTVVATLDANTTQHIDLVAAGSYTYCVTAFNLGGESAAACAGGSSTPPPAFYAPRGNYYEPVTAPFLTWSSARSAAETYSFLGSPGHLATITDSGENTFVAQLSGVDRWLGGYQADTGNEPAGGWVWVTGEPFAFTSWANGEPNNNDIGGQREDYLEIKDAGGGWNDVVHDDANVGYVVEYETGWPLQAPASVVASDSVDPITLQWSAVTGASGYLIHRAGTLIASVSAAVTSFVDRPAPGSYLYCVRATNPCGSEAGPRCDWGTMPAAPPPPPPPPPGSTLPPGGGVGPSCLALEPLPWKKRFQFCPIEVLGSGEARYELRVRGEDGHAVKSPQLRVLAVDHAPGQVAFLVGDRAVVGVPGPPGRVRMAGGDDASGRLAARDGVCIEGRAGESLIVEAGPGGVLDRYLVVAADGPSAGELRLADGASLRLRSTGGVDDAPAADEAGMLVQVMDEGAWRTVARTPPLEGITAVDLGPGPPATARILFPGGQRLDFVGGLGHPAREVAPVALRIVGTRDGGAGAPAGSPAASRGLDGRDPLEGTAIELAGPARPPGLDRTLFVAADAVVAGPDREAPASALAAQPNPASRETRIGFALTRGALVRIEVVDLQGRRVRVLADAYHPAGHHARDWDLRDETGRRVRPGIYLCRLAAGRSGLRSKLVVLP